MQKYVVGEINKDVIKTNESTSLGSILSAKADLEDFIAEAIDRFEQKCIGVEIADVQLEFQLQEEGKKQPIKVTALLRFPNYRKEIEQ